jgi:mono/diheme cytochrome c family protein
MSRFPRASTLCKVAGLLGAARALGVTAAFGVAPALAAEPPPAPTIDWLPASVAPAANATRGYVLFQQACSVCHGRGPAKPGTRALRAKYQGKEPALLEERRDLAADYVREIVRHGVSVMPPFRKTELSDADVNAIVDYLTRKR